MQRFRSKKTMAWHELGIEETIKKLETRIEGLSDREVEERLNCYGKNDCNYEVWEISTFCRGKIITNS